LWGRWIAYEDAQRPAYVANFFDRLGILLRVSPRMRKLDWWRLLGEQWSGCDNIAELKNPLRAAMLEARRRELDQMMDHEARRAFDSLPEPVLVFRGCHKQNVDGLSWTLERSFAKHITTLNRYRRPGRRLVAHGVAPK
jgi:hypothetical protein